MPDEPTPTPNSVVINAKVENVTGTTAIGTQINQKVTEIKFSGLPPNEQAEISKAFADFRAEVEREAPPAVKDEAVRQATEIERAAAAPTPDLGAIATARRWFLDHAPTLFGAVTAVLANPILGKVVQAAGDAVADEFKRRFPDSVPTEK